MDPALLRERELFKKKAFATPVIEKKRKEEFGDGDSRKKAKVEPPSNQSSLSSNLASMKASAATYKNIAAGSAYKFGILTKIVKHLKQKFQDAEDHPLTIEEILDETNQLDVSTKIRQWLQAEALPNNPKIEMTYDGKFQFKPPLKCRDKKSLVRLLRQHDMKGLGGILRDDIVESVPHAERVLKAIDSDLITIIRQDKKKVIFYNDRLQLTVDDEFQKLWRSVYLFMYNNQWATIPNRFAVAVDGIDDVKIEEYLEKQGIRSMQDDGIKKKIQPAQRRKGQRKKQIKKPKDNEHIANELRNYQDGE